MYTYASNSIWNPYTAENQTENCSAFLFSITVEETPNLITDFSFFTAESWFVGTKQGINMQT